MDAVDDVINSVFLGSSQSNTVYGPPELAGMTLLLKTPYVLDTRHREINLELRWQFPPAC